MTNSGDISNNPVCRVLFVDDHPLVLSGFADMLKMHGYEVVTAKNLKDATEKICAPDSYDLVLLDINLGQESGLSLLTLAPGQLPEKVVLISGVIEQEWILQGFALGAFAYIPKNVEPEDVVEALRQTRQQQHAPHSGWVWDERNRKLVDAHDFFPRHTLLTPKEREVFILLRSGKMDKQIADDLGLSIHTVRVHIRAIKRKRGHNRRFEQDS